MLLTVTDREPLRRRRERLRTVAMWLTVLGAVVALWAVTFLALGVSMFGGFPLNVRCGSILEPVIHAPGQLADACGTLLFQHGTVAFLCALLAIALLATGIAIFVHAPRPLSF